jgi:hypothetical protein
MEFAMEKTNFFRVSLLLLSFIICPLAQGMDNNPGLFSSAKSQCARMFNAIKQRAANSGAWQALSGCTAAAVIERGVGFCWKNIRNHPVVCATLAAVALVGGSYLLIRNRLQKPAVEPVNLNNKTDTASKEATANVNNIEEARQMIQAITRAINEDAAALNTLVKNAEELTTLKAIGATTLSKETEYGNLFDATDKRHAQWEQHKLMICINKLANKKPEIAGALMDQTDNYTDGFNAILGSLAILSEINAETIEAARTSIASLSEHYIQQFTTIVKTTNDLTPVVVPTAPVLETTTTTTTTTTATKAPAPLKEVVVVDKGETKPEQPTTTAAATAPTNTGWGWWNTAKNWWNGTNTTAAVK